MLKILSFSEKEEAQKQIILHVRASVFNIVNSSHKAWSRRRMKQMIVRASDLKLASPR